MLIFLKVSFPFVSHITENSFRKQNQHLMKKWSIHNAEIIISLIRIILLFLCDQTVRYESLKIHV